jgi:class 3 adenylate cyclase
MRRELNVEELAARAGVPVARLEEWRARGFVGSSSGFEVHDIERVRLIQLFIRCGIREEVIAKSIQEGVLQDGLDWYVELVFPGPEREAYTLEEVAQELGLDRDLVHRLWRAVGKLGDILNVDDKEVLRMSKIALDAGVPEEAQVQLIRVYSDALGRAAEAMSRAFHFYVHEPLSPEGQIGPEVERAESAVRPLREPFIMYFHRLGRARAYQHDLLLHLFEEAGMLRARDVRGQLLAAVAFVDLSSFTPLTEAMGDLRAAEVIERFAGLVRDSANRRDGRVVKQIGDGFMLVFPEPSSAVQCALDIEACATQEPQFPAVRSGVHWGAMLYRHGDYVGASVNIAARLTAVARRHEVLVSDAVRRAVRDMPDVEFVRYGQQQLKGVSEAVDVFAVRRNAEPGPARVVDPVCGMELGPAEVAARLSFGGRDHVFCSEDCLRRFVAGPERYARV